jgi:pimeloyl-ACP methyl ester carboxylesterase
MGAACGAELAADRKLPRRYFNPLTRLTGHRYGALMAASRTIVFVHGVPETNAIWRPLVEALGQRDVGEVVAISPPGFGAPLPDGFEPSMSTYTSWLADQLESIGGDIDLVGHDWGAGHVYGLLVNHPELVRTWATDIPGIIHRDYEWHDMAQAWQTPDIGEQVIAGMTGGTVDERAALFVGLDMPDDIAADLAAGLNETMGRCILPLYREAAQPMMGELGDRVMAAERPPGLVINATADEYVPASLSNDMAIRLGAEVLQLDGRGHWWMVRDVDEVADGLIAFWAAN